MSALPTLLCGCGLFGKAEPRVGKMTVSELERATQTLSDRYVQLVAHAVDEIKRAAGSIEARNEAHLLKLRTGLAAYDIVTGSGPVQQMMDLAVLAELQHIVWVSEGQAAKKFDARGAELLGQAITESRKEAWALCRRALSNDSVRKLQKVILEWRRRNAEVTAVHLVRFDVVADTQQTDPISALMGLLGSTIDLVSPINIDPMADSVDNAHVLLHRMFHYFKRLPMIVDWQAEATVMNALDIPQAAEIVRGATRVVDQAEGFLAQVERLIAPPEEGRERPFDPTLREARDLAVALKEAVESFHGLMKELKGSPESKPEPEPPTDGNGREPAEKGRPFDIRDYGAVAVEITRMSERLTEAIRETRGLAESPEALGRTQQLLGQSAQEVAGQGRQLVNHATVRLAVLIVLLGGVLVGVKAFAYWLSRRRQASA